MQSKLKGMLIVMNREIHNKKNVMNKHTNLKRLNLAGKFILALAVILTSFAASVKTFAQSVPEKVDVDINTGGDTVWYGQPWVWAVGVAVFIVIIIAITRSGNKNNA